MLEFFITIFLSPVFEFDRDISNLCPCSAVHTREKFRFGGRDGHPVSELFGFYYLSGET